MPIFSETRNFTKIVNTHNCIGAKKPRQETGALHDRHDRLQASNTCGARTVYGGSTQIRRPILLPFRPQGRWIL